MIGHKEGSATEQKQIYPPTYDSSGISLYYNKIKINSGKVIRGSTERLKVLRFGNVEDLRINDAHHDLEEYIRTAFGERQIPVYIFDDHNHALFAWREALVEGRIAESAQLLHFDEHHDCRNPFYDPLYTNPGLSLKEIARICQEQLEINDFIAPAVWTKTICKPTWIDPEYQGISEENHLRDSGGRHHPAVFHMGIDHFKSYFQLPQDPKHLAVDIDLDYFSKIEDPEREVKDIALMRQAMQKAGVITFATSPGHIDHTKAIDLVKKLLTQ